VPRQSTVRELMFSGSLVALVTPMLEDGAIDLDAWDRLLDLHLRSDTAAVVVGGSTERATIPLT